MWCFKTCTVLSAESRWNASDDRLLYYLFLWNVCISFDNIYYTEFLSHAKNPVVPWFVFSFVARTNIFLHSSFKRVAISLRSKKIREFILRSHPCFYVVWNRVLNLFVVWCFHKIFLLTFYWELCNIVRIIRTLY